MPLCARSGTLFQMWTGDFYVHKCHGRVYVDCDGEYDYEETVEHVSSVSSVLWESARLYE